ncbi:MAG: hypothetical protein M0016_06645 [Deltaproteobacteria bacterium]|jgi:uncharacterized membrane protein|nr:hypothetical protein [Deltaproteobacteria bacterium]MCL5880126.1 hypothetical protein [Deltaproteobacteria bacterium]MDA8304824.1 hypothetical protein [Deltaproteobacteria bacterium]
MNLSILIFIAVFSVAVIELSEVAAIIFVVGEDVGLSSALAGGITGFFGSLLILFIGGITLIKSVPISTVKLIIAAILLTIGLYFSYKLLSFIFYMTPFSSKLGGKPLFKKMETATVAHKKCSPHSFFVAFSAVIVEAFEVGVVAVPFAITDNQWISVISSLVVSSCLILILSLHLRKYFKKIPSHWIKGIASVLLISFAIYWGFQGLKIKIEDEDLILIIPMVGGVLFIFSLLLDKVGHKVKNKKDNLA